MNKKNILRFITSTTTETLIPKWLADKEVTKYLYRGKIPTKNAENRYLSDIEFEIYDKSMSEEEVIGCGGIHQVNWISRSAELRIMIGNKDYWGMGIGKLAIKELMNYGFQTLNMNRLWLGVNEHNQQAYHAYKKCGFVEEGRLKEEFFKDGLYCDIIRMGILKNDYDKIIQ
tara:strand:+ start:2038 stop:2553 length:516 start_codon:yes stop_codon:yes gene_type:complete